MASDLIAIAAVARPASDKLFPETVALGDHRRSSAFFGVHRRLKSFFCPQGRQEK